MPSPPLYLWSFDGVLSVNSEPVLSMWQTLFAIDGVHAILTDALASDVKAWLDSYAGTELGPAVARVDRVIAVPPGEEPAPMRWAAEVEAQLGIETESHGDGKPSVVVVFDHRSDYLAAILTLCPAVKVFEVRLEDAVAKLDRTE